MHSLVSHPDILFKQNLICCFVVLLCWLSHCYIKQMATNGDDKSRKHFHQALINNWQKKMHKRNKKKQLESQSKQNFNLFAQWWQSFRKETTVIVLLLLPEVSFIIVVLIILVRMTKSIFLLSFSKKSIFVCLSVLFYPSVGDINRWFVKMELIDICL